LCIFTLCTLPLELISNDKPLIISYQNKIYLPFIHDYSDSTFGGSLAGQADYLDPFIRNAITGQDGAKINQNNWAIYPLNQYNQNTINYFYPNPNPAPPSKVNYFGTDDAGRDILSRLLYGLRLSLWFGFALAIINLAIGAVIGAVQAYFGGKVDLITQRFLEIWGNIPEMYLLIIIASIFQPNIILLLIIFSLFSWIGTSDYIRSECFKIKEMDYIKAAKITGLSNWQIIKRHMLPNVITPLITMFPFKVSQGIIVLTAMDFLGLGLPQTTPSMGSLLSQAKSNLEAWWISVPTVASITLIVLLLTFIGDGLRQAFNVQK
jgi:microcin C transport system permease protein